ncbi:MAG: response regulator transcription factor [Candidatus Omnitrophica bacterium]|nr:response regulator transcription factor [Candidatus Omnitrophota bacterium]
MINKTMLIIDDHKDFRGMLRWFIENRVKDIEIKEAATGEEGVDMAIAEKPDISLIDIRLPGIDGIETAKQIKQRVPESQIITMSMFKQSSVESLIAQQVVIFLNKETIDSELIPLLYKLFNENKT